MSSILATRARSCLAGALLLLPLAGCARMESPRGGPPDNVPPVVVSTFPDTFAVMEPFRDPVIIRFSERISERPLEGTVEDAVLVSPATSEVEVELQRSAVEVSLIGGFEAGYVYRVRINPVIVDMFSNPMLDPFELVFSTGPDLSEGAVGGLVLDRITGDPVQSARIHARDPERAEGPPYVAASDSGGVFVLRYLPPASYDITAFVDQNRNREVDTLEARATTSAVLSGPADTVFVSMEALAPDTIPARVTTVEAADSASLRIETDDFLDPARSLEGVEVTVSREGGPAPEVDSLFHRHEWEARAAALAPAADAAGDTAAAALDPAAADPAAADTTGADAPAADTAAADAPDGAGAPPVDGTPGGVPRSEQELYGTLTTPLEAGEAYEVSVSGIVNIAGTPGGGGEGSVVWEPPPPDTASAPADSVGGGAAGADPDGDAPPDDAPPDDDAPPPGPPDGGVAAPPPLPGGRR